MELGGQTMVFFSIALDECFSRLKNSRRFVVDDIPELKADFGVSDALDKRVEGAAHCFQTLSTRELRCDSRALPPGTERAVPANDAAIADFRDWHSRSK